VFHHFGGFSDFREQIFQVPSLEMPLDTEIASSVVTGFTYAITPANVRMQAMLSFCEDLVLILILLYSVDST
jgi:hypothetical protein